MKQENQIPENLPVGGSDVPSIKIQESREGLEGLKDLLSSVFSKGDKAARAALGPAAGPVEGLLSLFDRLVLPKYRYQKVKLLNTAEAKVRRQKLKILLLLPYKLIYNF